MKYRTGITIAVVFLASCYGCIMFGIYLGRALAISDFDGPRRDLGRALSDLNADMKSKNSERAEARISYLSENWYSIAFFQDQESNRTIPWYRFISDYEKIEKKTN